MEDALKRYTSNFHGNFSERKFCDIHFAFLDSASASAESLDGAEVVSAHRHVMVAASPYLCNKIELMGELGLSASTKGSSRDKPWLLPGIDKHAFEIIVDFMYHPRDLSVHGAIKELDGAMSPAIARAVFKAAHLLLMPVVQAMMFKMLAAQITPTNCLGALQLCMDSKGQWAQLEGQGEALSERARQMFALKPVEATDIALKVVSGNGDTKGDIDATLSYSLANCDLNFFEVLFGTSFPVKDSVACNAFFSLLLAWRKVAYQDVTAASLLNSLALHVKEMPPETFIWSVSAHDFSGLRSQGGMNSPNFKVYGYEFHLTLVKDDRGSTNTALYLTPNSAMPGWVFSYMLTMKATPDLPATSKSFGVSAFLKANLGNGSSRICSTAKLQLIPVSESPTYVTSSGTIKISVTITSTSLVRLGAAYLADNFESLIDDEFFGTIPSSMMKAVLPFDELRVSSELVLLRGLLKWNNSEDDVSDDMLKRIRLSQIDFEALLDETRVHACLQKSDSCKKHVETIIKNAYAGAPQSSLSMPAEQPRLYATAGSTGDVDCAKIVALMMHTGPSKKLAATWLFLNDVCHKGVSNEKEMQLKIDRLTQARAHDLLRRAGLRARCRLQARGHNGQRKRKAELELSQEKSLTRRRSPRLQ
jgi:hypothetical protein